MRMIPRQIKMELPLPCELCRATSARRIHVNSTAILVTETSVTVQEVEIVNRDVAAYFNDIPEQNRVDAFVRAVEVGTFCLEHASAAQDLEFVRREVASLMAGIEKRVSLMPAELERAVMARIGTGDGQVLAPVQAMIGQAVKVSADRLNDVRAMLSDIDPSKDGTAASRVVRSLRDLLDANRTDSVQATLKSAVASLAATDGTIAKTVQMTVDTAVKPLREELDRLAKEMRGQEAAAEALSQTTAKGASFEEEIVARLQPWARCTGAQVAYVGGDNRPGDIIVNVTSISPQPVSIVIEAKDRQSPKGRRAISDMLTAAMTERNTNAAIYVSRDAHGLANEIGEWAEGECGCGAFVACTYEHLNTALRFLIIQRKLATLQASRQEIDAATVVAQITRIRTSLDRIKNINRKTNDIRSCAGDIENESGQLRAEIRDALTAIEEMVQKQAPIRKEPEPVQLPA